MRRMCARRLRVGMMEARRDDEYLGLRHGLIGQETTGVGGMAKALRTIPVLLQHRQDVREVAQPGALLVNFTNPSGLVTQALSQYAPDVQSVGVCNAPFNMKMDTLQRLEKLTGQSIDPSRGELNTLGLNHLTWHRGFTLDGEDVWPRVLEDYLNELHAEAEPEYDPRLIESLRMIPNYYLEYFYTTDRKLAEQKQWPPSRAEQVIEIEDDLLRQYAEPDRTEPPADLMKRGGAYYSTVATQLLNAHYNDLGETHVVNVRHDGAVPGWPVDWVLELPCKVDRAGHSSAAHRAAAAGLFRPARADQDRLNCSPSKPPCTAIATRPIRPCSPIRLALRPIECRRCWTICWRRIESICRSSFTDE